MAHITIIDEDVLAHRQRTDHYRKRCEALSSAACTTQIHVRAFADALNGVAYVLRRTSQFHAQRPCLVIVVGDQEEANKVEWALRALDVMTPVLCVSREYEQARDVVPLDVQEQFVQIVTAPQRAAS